MIVLASASPRRRELLAAVGLRFRVEVAGIDESLGGDLDPVAEACGLAARKARAVAARLRAGGEGTATWVVGADTVVAVPAEGRWRILGKPADSGEARAMLSLLSSRRHAVITGVCVVPAEGGAEAAGSETTWVTMRAITAAEIDAYVASGEWRDKAGGYAIQESADAFVTSLEDGGFDNVVGLPVGLTLDLLSSCGVPSRDLYPSSGGGPPS